MDRGRYVKERYQKNKEIVKARNEAYRIAKKTAQPLYWAIVSARGRCKKKSEDFDLVEKELVIPEYCPYLGIKIESGKGRLHDASPSLDRRDPSKSYTMDNIQIVSLLANRMKNSATEEQLITFAENVLKLHRK